MWLGGEGKYCTRYQVGTTGNVATGHGGRDDCILMDKLKINCPMGRCTYFVLKLSKRNCLENKRKTNKEKTVDRTPIVRMEMATMSTDDERRATEPEPHKSS